MNNKNNNEIIKKKFEDLINTMKYLRSIEGCEWDRKQTHESLKPYLVEEAYELIESINNKNYEEICDELGDVLLQVIFHSLIAEENNNFSLFDVLNNINEKMIRRHPHVFSNSGNYSYEQWETLKAKEKNSDNFCRIGKNKKGLPPLIRFRRLIENSLAVDVDPYFNKKIFELIKSDVDNKNIKEIIKKIIYYAVKEKLDLDSLINEISDDYYNQFVVFESDLGEDFNNISKEKKYKLFKKYEEDY